MDKLFEAAANWWADQISGAKLNWDNGAQNEGDAKEREMGHLMWMMGNINANQAREGISSEQIQKFKDSLIRRMSERYNKAIQSYPEYHLTLSVDYHPDEILAESVREAGISTEVFPCKTCMWIDSKRVSAKRGYGAQERIIAQI
jgi:hypothetical protein